MSAVDVPKAVWNRYEELAGWYFTEFHEHVDKDAAAILRTAFARLMAEAYAEGVAAERARREAEDDDADPVCPECGEATYDRIVDGLCLTCARADGR